jgi:hypothetical protein
MHGKRISISMTRHLGKDKKRKMLLMMTEQGERISAMVYSRIVYSNTAVLHLNGVIRAETGESRLAARIRKAISGRTVQFTHR